jgi:hypothetical protein
LRVLALVGTVALSACGSSSTSPKTTSAPATTAVPGTVRPGFTVERTATGDYIAHLKPGVVVDQVCGASAKPELHAELLRQLAALGLAHGVDTIVEFMDGYPAPGTVVNTTLCLS